MNCEKIQELILTDYLDGEIDKRQEEFIKQHLATCIGCQEFLSIAQKTVVEPFLNAGKVTPDE
ncbi:MAG: zf-HC2 domain-containing protein, partial [Nitrospira sp.]|nr:zf-HC2 domain-containing protein [Nitrospira sp.]